MRTITRIMPYKLTKVKKAILIEKWLVNWCWWAKWVSFDTMFDIIIYVIKKAFWFKVKKLNRLRIDINQLCKFWHDVSFSLWGNLIDFYKDNLQFIDWIMQLLHWTKPRYRFTIATILFLGLNTVWLKYFTFRKKRLKLDDLFINL